MDHNRTADSPVLLLERPTIEPSGCGSEDLLVDLDVVLASKRSKRDCPRPARSEDGGSMHPASSPSQGLALLAAVSVLEGYVALGLISVSDSRASTFLFGRLGTALFAALAVVSLLTFARPRRAGRTAVAASIIGGGVVAVVAATGALLVVPNGVTTHLVGGADLLLALGAGLCLLTNELGKRRAAQPVRRPLAPSAKTTQARIGHVAMFLRPSGRGARVRSNAAPGRAIPLA